MKVRFFASAALRPSEEFDGVLADLVPRWIAVEYDGDRPVTGVWRSRAGQRRVCWYREEGEAFDHGRHDERYGDEPYWIVERRGGGGVRVDECDPRGQVVVTHLWSFDRDAMPRDEEVRDGGGAVSLRRHYGCINWGIVSWLSEQRPPDWREVELPLPDELPCEELAGEIYPCGGTFCGGRILDVVAQNQCQGRYLVAVPVAAGWRLGIVTAVMMKYELEPGLRKVVDWVDPALAEELGRGVLEHPRQTGFRLRGCIEAIPAGESLETLVARAPIGLEAAVGLAAEIGAVALRAEARGHMVGAIRPELIYAAPHEGRLTLSGVLHRGPALLKASYTGEAVLVGPAYPADFASPNDVVGLAQLVWFMVTGTHPWYAPEHVRWQLAWDFRQESKRRPQPWTGPASLGPLLEHVLFGAGGQAMSMTVFLDRLAEAGRG